MAFRQPCQSGDCGGPGADCGLRDPEHDPGSKGREIRLRMQLRFLRCLRKLCGELCNCAGRDKERNADMIETIVKVDGMMCGMCEAHVNDAVRRAMPVKKVSSSHVKGETVILSEDAPDPEKIRDAINPTGYTVMGISSRPYEKKGLGALFG